MKRHKEEKTISNLIQDEIFLDAQRIFSLILSSKFDLYYFFFTHFDFVRMTKFRGSHVMPYMSSFSRQLCIMIFKFL